MEEHVLLFEAVRHLGIDVPVLKYEVLQPGIIRLWLYGGKVVEYQHEQTPQASAVVVETTKKRGKNHGN